MRQRGRGEGVRLTTVEGLIIMPAIFGVKQQKRRATTRCRHIAGHAARDEDGEWFLLWKLFLAQAVWLIIGSSDKPPRSRDRREKGNPHRYAGSGVWRGVFRRYCPTSRRRPDRAGLFP